MCQECDKISRRNFITTTSLLTSGFLFASSFIKSFGFPLLKDNEIIEESITYKNGRIDIKGFLVRPKSEIRLPGIIISHGNPGVPSDIIATAKLLAKAGYVALIYDWASRAPMPSSDSEVSKWRDEITGYSFFKTEITDIRSAIKFLNSKKYIYKKKVGLVGFCGGGKMVIHASSHIKHLKAVVAFYAPVRYNNFRSKSDPSPEIIDIVEQIKVPIQGHYGEKDSVALVKDTREFEAKLIENNKTIEMYYYPEAGHSFCNFNRPPGSSPGFDYFPQAAELSQKRMIDFFKKYI